MTRIVLFVAALALAACGVDGPPQPPKSVTKPGVSISGEARMGVSGRL